MYELDSMNNICGVAYKLLTTNDNIRWTLYWTGNMTYLLLGMQ